MVAIGTWNLENFFRPGTDGGASTQAAYDAKVAALASVIASMSPDVLAVQEVGGLDALQDLAAAVGQQTGGTWSAYTADPDGRGIRVGFLSRTELTQVTQVSAFPPGLHPIQDDDSDTIISSMGRPALSAHASIDGYEVDLVTAHLKSKLLTFPGGAFSTRDEGCEPGSAPTPCSDALPKPPPSVPTPPACSTHTATTDP